MKVMFAQLVIIVILSFVLAGIIRHKTADAAGPLPAPMAVGGAAESPAWAQGGKQKPPTLPEVSPKVEGVPQDIGLPEGAPQVAPPVPQQQQQGHRIIKRQQAPVYQQAPPMYQQAPQQCPIPQGGYQQCPPMGGGCGQPMIMGGGCGQPMMGRGCW